MDASLPPRLVVVAARGERGLALRLILLLLGCILADEAADAMDASLPPRLVVVEESLATGSLRLALLATVWEEVLVLVTLDRLGWVATV